MSGILASITEASLRFECFTLNKQHPFYSLAGAAVHSGCLAAFLEAREFLSFYFGALVEHFQTSGYWMLGTVGDQFTDLMDSTECMLDPPEYDTQEVLRSLLELESTECVATGNDLRVTWEAHGEAIEYIMASSSPWTGACLTLLCSPETFLIQWRHLKRQFECVYLTDTDCGIWAPDFFESVYVNPPLRQLRDTLKA